MPNSLQSSAIPSPAAGGATNCSLSSITEHSFQGIAPSPYGEKVLPMCPVQCVTYVSGRSPLSIQQFTLRFQLQVLLRFYGQYGQHRRSWAEVRNPSPPFLLVPNGMQHLLSSCYSRLPRSHFHGPSKIAPSQHGRDSFWAM